MIMIFIVGLAIWYYFCYDDTIMFSTTQDHYDGKLNMTTWSISYNFTASVISAQNNINVTIIAIPTQEYHDRYPEKFKDVSNLSILVHLPEAMPDTPQFEDGHMLAEVVTVKYDDKHKLFEGKTRIKYLSEGYKCASITENEQIIATYKKCEGQDPLIYVSSADSKFQYDNNKNILALTLVFLALTIFALRSFVESVGYNLSCLINKNRNSTIKPTHTKK